ncbi:MAG: hypothetical protein OXL38_22290 [Gammaproteobacteria bacterium]|nr:hypothetical protein [Gammaproteobacteria bacterium]
MMVAYPKVTTVVGLLLVTVLAGSVPVFAEEYRFPGTFMVQLGAAIADKEVDGSGAVSYSWSNVEVASRIPTDLAFVFDAQSDPLFPDSITSVFAVKPKGGGMRDILMAPMRHRGGGEYRFGERVGHDVRSWFEAHEKELFAGNIVLERIDGLYDALAKANPGVAIGVSSRLTFAGNEVKTQPAPPARRSVPGRRQEILDAFIEGRELPDWYVREIGPEQAAQVEESIARHAAAKQRRSEESQGEVGNVTVEVGSGRYARS